MNVEAKNLEEKINRKKKLKKFFWKKSEKNYWKWGASEKIF